MRVGDHAARAFEQRLEHLVRRQACDAAAEVEQQVHFLQAAAGLVEQEDVLQDDRGLPRDLEVDLAVFVGKGGQRLGGDGQHGGHHLVADRNRQADHAFGPQCRQQGCVAPLFVFVEVGNQDRVARLQDDTQRVTLTEQGFHVGGARDASQRRHQARTLGRVLGHQGGRHAQLGERLGGERLERRGGVQLAADRFGDGQARADALGAAFEVVQGDGLLEVLAQQHGQVVLADAEQLLLTLDAVGERRDAGLEGVQAARVADEQGGLGGKALGQFDGGKVGPQTVGGIVQADEAQEFALRVFERDEQEIVRIPGVLRRSGHAFIARIHVVHVGRQDGRLVSGDEVRAADLELGLHQLLDTGQWLFAGQQLVQGFLGKAHACDASQHARLRLEEAYQHHAEGGGRADALRQRVHGLLHRDVLVQGLTDLGQLGEGFSAAAQQLGALALLLVLLGVVDGDGRLGCHHLHDLDRLRAEERRLVRVQIQQAHHVALMQDGYHQRRTNVVVRRVSAACVEIVHHQRLPRLDHLAVERAQAVIDGASHRHLYHGTLGLVPSLEQQDRPAARLQNAQALLVDDRQQVLEVERGAQLAADARDGRQLLDALAQACIGLTEQAVAFHRRGQLSRRRGDDLQVEGAEVLHLLAAQHQLAQAVLAHHQWDHQRRFHLHGIFHRAVERQHAAIGAEAAREERLAAVRNRQQVFGIVHEQGLERIQGGFGHVPSRLAVQAQLPKFIVQQEDPACIRLEEADQFLHRELEYFIQRGRRGREAGDAPQGVRALCTRTGLLHQHGVLDDGGRLIGDNAHQTHFFVAERGCPAAVMGDLQKADHAFVRDERHKRRVAQGGGHGHVGQAKGMPVLILRGVDGQDRFLVRENALGGTVSGDGGAVDLHDGGRQPAEGNLRFEHAAVLVVQQEAHDLRVEERGHAVHQTGEQVARFLNGADGLRQVGESCQFRSASLFFFI